MLEMDNIHASGKFVGRLPNWLVIIFTCHVNKPGFIRVQEIFIFDCPRDLGTGRKLRLKLQPPPG